MRLRGRTIGALNLFRTHQGALTDDDVVVAQGLADIATIAILQYRSTLDSGALNVQLSNALNSRIIIEQAKGMVRQSTGCDMDEAFNRLRTHARNHNVGLTELAKRLIGKSIDSNNLDEVQSNRS